MSTFVPDLIIGMLFISAASMACLGLYGKRFIDRVPAATPYVLVMFCAAAWAVLYALDLLSSSLPVRVAYHNLRFLFLPFFSFFELWLVIAYVKKTEWLRWDWAALALIIPVTAAVLAITSPFHELFRYNFSINTAGPVPVLQYSESAFFMVYSVYSIFLFILAIVILVVETRNKGTLWEMQTLLLVAALTIPMVLNTAFQAGLTPVAGVNMTATLFWIPAILYTVALFRYRFLDIVPIARGRLIEVLSEPVLVLNMDRRLIDLNPAACSLFSLNPMSAKGKPVEELVPDWPEFLSLCGSDRPQRMDLIREGKDGVHYYIGSIEILLTRSGEADGRLIILQDVTDLKKAQQAVVQTNKKLNILSSVTRHDILNTITALYALLDLSRDICTSQAQGEHIDKEIKTVQTLQRQVEFTKYYQDLGVHVPEWQDIETIFNNVVSQLPLEGISIRLDCRGYQVYADPLIQKVFYNLVENSLRHGGHVTSLHLSMERTGNGFLMIYGDNGAGIPADSKEKLFQRGFGKNTGLGLFLSREILAITGIQITETGEPGKGARFEMTIPAGEVRYVNPPS